MYMYKRKDFQELMPTGYDIMVHIWPSVGSIMPTKAVHITIKGTCKVTGKYFEDEATEIFHSVEIADTVTRLLKAHSIASAEYTDVTIWQ